MRDSGLADLLPSLPETVWVGVSAGSMVMTPRIGTYFVEWPSAPDDRTLGVVDFSIFPHLDAFATNTLAHAERWAAGRPRWAPGLVDSLVVVSARDTHRTLTHLIRACDVVFGSTSILLAMFATSQWLAGVESRGLVLALWAVPVANITWSLVTKHRDRVQADLVRGFVCAPLATYIYASGSGGVLMQLWLSGLMLSVAVCLSVGIGTQKLLRSVSVAVVYSLGILMVGGLRASAIRDAVGLMLTDTILSIVAVHLGRSLIDATHQRDEAREQRVRAEVTLGQLTERTDALSRALVELQREMTRRRQLEAELVQAQKLESVGRLAAGVAHEINTPVQFVGDNLHFIRDAVGDLLELAHRTVEIEPADPDLDLAHLTAEVPKALEHAQEGLRRVATIVRSMRVFAHPDSEGMTRTDLNCAIEATLVVARNEYKFVADLVTDFAPDLPPVSCFISELNQAVLNIVVNAAHAIGDVVASSEARGTIEVRTRRHGDNAVVSIRDTGSGIPEAIRTRVFDPFFTTKDVGKGTGQGLSIAHSVIVDKHRGKLWFETELGRGTTFVFQIPIAGAR
jgi:signal transduction histidine kinase